MLSALSRREKADAPQTPIPGARSQAHAPPKADLKARGRLSRLKLGRAHQRPSFAVLTGANPHLAPTGEMWVARALGTGGSVASGCREPHLCVTCAASSARRRAVSRNSVRERSPSGQLNVSCNAASLHPTVPTHVPTARPSRSDRWSARSPPPGLSTLGLGSAFKLSPTPPAASSHKHGRPHARPPPTTTDDRNLTPTPTVRLPPSLLPRIGPEAPRRAFKAPCPPTQAAHCPLPSPKLRSTRARKPSHTLLPRHPRGGFDRAFQPRTPTASTPNARCKPYTKATVRLSYTPYTG